MSDEHAWLEWARKHLQRKFASENPGEIIKTQEFREKVEHDGNFDEITTLLDKHKSGAPSSFNVSCVCVKCNNEWMSAIDEDAKPHLENFLYGYFCSLSEDESRKIALWLSLKLAIIEQKDRKNATVSDADMREIYENKQPALGIWIYASHCGAAPFEDFISYSPTRIISPADLSTRNIQSIPYNSNFLSLGFGECIFHVFYTSTKFKPEFRLKKYAFTLIWPSENAVRWPPPYRLPPEVALDVVTGNFDRETKQSFGWLRNI